MWMQELEVQDSVRRIEGNIDTTLTHRERNTAQHWAGPSKVTCLDMRHLQACANLYNA
jgi:hypothetical protein